MSDYAYGEPVTITMKDAAGAVANLTAYDEVVLTIDQPDGTSVVKKKSDATLTANPYIFLPTQHGGHVHYYVTTNPNGATEPQRFNVEAPGDAGIVSASDVRDHLNETTTADDAELVGFIRAATVVVENIVGPVGRKSYDEWHDGGGTTVVLAHYPVLTIDSVTEYGPDPTVLTAEPFGTATFTDTGYQDDKSTGVIYRTNGGLPTTFAPGGSNVHVTYTAGRVDVPPNVRLATLELIRHLYQFGQVGLTPAFGMPESDLSAIGGATLIAGYSVPNRVLELLAPHRKAPHVG